MCSSCAADSASRASTLAATSGSSMASHKTPAPALVTRSLAYGSRISGSGRSVSTARAAATITAVVPTLVLMSQLSSWVRSELMPYSLVSFWSGGWLAETRAQPGAADGLVSQVFGYRVAQAGHFVAVVDAMYLPAVVGQPLNGIRTVRLGIGQRFDIDTQAEPLPHSEPALRVARIHAEHLDGDLTARRAQRGEHLEQPVLRIAGQVGQQALGEPCGRLGAVESGGGQGCRPVITQIHWDRAPAGGRDRAVLLENPGLVLQHLGLVDLVDGGIRRPMQPVRTRVQPGG